MKRICYSLLIPLIAGGLSGCASTNAASDDPESEGGGGDSPRRPALPAFTSQEVTRNAVEGIQFGDASSEIEESQKPRVKAVATYLKVRAERVIVAGGAQVTSSEYARQLGQQRALAVRQALIREGIPANKIVTASYGLYLPGKGGDRVEFGFLPTGEKPF